VLRSYTLPALAALALAAGFAWRMERPEGDRRLVLELDRAELPADGFSSATLSARSTNGELEAEYRVVDGSRAVRLQKSRLTATVLPGRAVIEGRAMGFRPDRISIETRAVFSDRAQDGTPDFLRLDDPADREAFARRFAYLAEAQYMREPGMLPSEISDCAALIRYAYREGLRDVEAASEPPPQKYQYPFTPLGPSLFRVMPGAFKPSDLTNGAFAEFADAKTLRLHNTHFVSRNIRHARQGDLLFYRQLDQRMPFHAMVYLGRSRFEADPGARVVYHTGPVGSDKGEIRRPFVTDLLRHPQPQWRPVAGNSNFLGVYRWNILKEDF
jgi:uncharacterized protein YfaT (DUF1175 family)